jgi:hypothetical protein
MAFLSALYAARCSFDKNSVNQNSGSIPPAGAPRLLFFRRLEQHATAAGAVGDQVIN